jgi:hypothetical protein
MHKMTLLIQNNSSWSQKSPTIVRAFNLEVGFRLLKVLAATNRPMMLRDIAKGAGMPAAKALDTW